ncbi:hypothetical protein [Nonomuraea soli]|uniref:Sensor domain-containing protein n=1 Tax=Nonomuraea soli TaxID=1032476 RepID=A0A7W0CDL9_9ACTN|nr:hypothetical protein [Nonomuraea soli]MBA2889079.1 hypothetical protein [Nonomuraea soli]
MNRGLWSTLACAALLLAGCTSGGGQYTDGEVHQELVRLRQMLNRSPALPDGFSDKAQPAWKPPFAAGSRACRAILQATSGHAPPRAIMAQAAVTYEGDLLGELAAVGLASYTGGEADWHMRDLGKALDGCASLASGSGTSLPMRDLPLPVLGDGVDGAVARQARGRLNGYPYALNLMLVRSGDTIISIVHTGLSKVDSKRTQQLARSFLK